MLISLVCALALQLGPVLATPNTHAVPLRAERGSFPPQPSGPGSAPGPSFHATQQVAHHDDFWSNMLSGDADHDGQQEFVLRYVSTGGPGGVQTAYFYEDDGSGHFSRVAGFPFVDSGLLALGDVDGDGLTDLFYERALGPCNHEYVRREASTPGGFPDHEVWTAVKQGNVVDFTAFLADSDGDGLQELITSDNNFSCAPTSLKVFESAPNDQMVLVLNLQLSGVLGNPVAADFDLNGQCEIVLAEMFSGQLLALEASANDTWNALPSTQHTLINAYQCALVAQFTPSGLPLLYLAGQVGSADYRVQCFARPPGAAALQFQHETLLPGQCGASVAQITAVDLVGSRRAEIVVDRICGPVPIYSIGPGGVLTLLDQPQVPEAIEVVGTRQTPGRPGALAIGRSLTLADPAGKTWVLRP